MPELICWPLYTTGEGRGVVDNFTYSYEYL
jgi:hypothetical protein